MTRTRTGYAGNAVRVSDAFGARFPVGAAGDGCRIALLKSGPPRCVNTCDDPKHKESDLLMPSTDPTGSGYSVALSVPAEHIGFLRRAFSAIQDGLIGDLAARPERLENPTRTRREAEAFGRLLLALETGACIPDPEMHAALSDMAASIDMANEYERINIEHAALHGLIDQLKPARTAAPGKKEEG